MSPSYFPTGGCRKFCKMQYRGTFLYPAPHYSSLTKRFQISAEKCKHDNITLLVQCLFRLGKVAEFQTCSRPTDESHSGRLYPRFPFCNWCSIGKSVKNRNMYFQCI